MKGHERPCSIRPQLRSSQNVLLRSVEPATDTVAKVENRTTLKISRKLIFRLLCCCLAIQRRYEGPWSISDGSIWSLTSPRVKRIRGSKKFRSSPRKDFFNTIGTFRT